MRRSFWPALLLPWALAGCAGLEMPFLSSPKQSEAARDMDYGDGATGGAASPAETSPPPPPLADAAPGQESFDEDLLLARLDVDDAGQQGQGGPNGPGGNGPGPNGPGGNGGGNGPGGNGGPNGQGGRGKGGAAEEQLVPPLPLLIYTAQVHLAVYEVAPTQRAVIQHARELGGYLARQSDQEVVVRVPSRRFQDALERIEKVGDVLHRDLQAQDVSEEYRDLSIRLRNAEVVRARLETLLAQAKNVEDALQVQRELARVTETIESMKGRLRFLQDRIAFSTITVRFAPREREPVGSPDVYRLPFPWLDELGLHSLLNMR